MTHTLNFKLHTNFSRILSEDGGTLVEFAISVILLLTVVFGIISCSFAVYSYFYTSDAAREATRYAIVRGSTLTGDCSAPGFANCIAQTGDIQTYVKNLGFPGINSSNVTVATTWLTSTGAACGTTDSCKAPGNQVQVKVTYTYPLSIPFAPSRSLSLTSSSQMFIAQ